MSGELRGRLIDRATKIARAVRAALASRAAVASGTDAALRKLLTAERIWPLSIILGSWELSNVVENRPELNRLLGAAGVPGMWLQLDLMTDSLSPFVVYAIDAQDDLQLAEAATRFLTAAQILGVELLEQVVKGRAFATAATVIHQTIPEPSARSAETPQTPPPSARSDGAMHLFVYLMSLGYSETQTRLILQGKR